MAVASVSPEASHELPTPTVLLAPPAAMNKVKLPKAVDVVMFISEAADANADVLNRG